ncbi:E3 ubiquitin-protein ligase RING2-like [Peromyscus californicus insignis]|uniref:E3 ubiquitin-protein ligase RING2-like n=1 Tax=Peromyscus californicus insignis TaxID=564181 RepID=UPI0022A803D7|nr:E3 ubiquitin-protein ligase RING2-like [Peromyscus californicus insignis]
MEGPEENSTKSLAQPNLRREEPQAVLEATMSQAVQTNEAQLVGETSEQGLQELQGRSQKETTNDLEIVASNGDEYNNFRCPICLDTLKNTRITKSCFHRFCKDCIITALRRGNKECPVCRRKLISKRSLDSDPQFDALIMKMHSSCNEKDASQEKTLSRKKKYKTQQALSVNIEKGKEMDTINSVQQGEEKQIETSTGWKGNHDTAPCNNTSTQSSDEAGPSNKKAKTSGLEHDNTDAIVTYDAVTDGASELESNLHPTLTGKDDPAQTGLTKTSGNSTTCQVYIWLWG